jgi:hypothetical protein
MGSKLIPKNLHAEFMAFMAAHDLGDLPDGAWFYTLEDAGETFAETHGLDADRNDLAHYYLSKT